MGNTKSTDETKELEEDLTKFYEHLVDLVNKKNEKDVEPCNCDILCSLCDNNEEMECECAEKTNEEIADETDDEAEETEEETDDENGENLEVFLNGMKQNVDLDEILDEILEPLEQGPDSKRTELKIKMSNKITINYIVNKYEKTLSKKDTFIIFIYGLLCYKIGSIF